MPVSSDCGLKNLWLRTHIDVENTLCLRCSRCRNGWLALEHDDSVSEVCRHDEIVLNDERRLLGMENEAMLTLRYGISEEADSRTA
jgi:hypothetical protein